MFASREFRGGEGTFGGRTFLILVCQFFLFTVILGEEISVLPT